MPQTISRALIGIAMLTTVVSAAAASPPLQSLVEPAPPAQIRVSLDVIEGFSGRMICLTPKERGAILVPTTLVPRGTCLSARDWVARHVIIADE